MVSYCIFVCPAHGRFLGRPNGNPNKKVCPGSRRWFSWCFWCSGRFGALDASQAYEMLRNYKVSGGVSYVHRKYNNNWNHGFLWFYENMWFSAKNIWKCWNYVVCRFLMCGDPPKTLKRHWFYKVPQQWRRMYPEFTTIMLSFMKIHKNALFSVIPRIFIKSK